MEIKTLNSLRSEIWSHPTWDLILLLVLLSGGFFYGISTGKRKIAANIIYTYVAYALAGAIPVEWFLKISNIAGGVFAKAGVFITIFLALVFLLGSRRKKWIFAPASSWWQVFLLSFIEVGLFIHILLGFLPADIKTNLAPLTKSLFANPDYHIWWMVVPILIIIVLKRFEGREE